ncbi:Inositol-tetrakisphosphate 1-kinase 1 [Diplonema papillatum]|nr:Inositol-tetrakisphosphate 1-kinase 1 [Diplonema papillatum]
MQAASPDGGARTVGHFGRPPVLRLCTVFAVDRNGKLKEADQASEGGVGGKVEITAMDVHRNLCDQWEALDVLPDVVVSKMHQALGTDTDPALDACKRHYTELTEKHKEEFEKRNLIPLACEIQLTTRKAMTRILERTCVVTSLITVGRPPCAAPQWCIYSRTTPELEGMPPFPVVVKPKSTDCKRMGLVFDLPGLVRFTESSEHSNDGFSVEHYVPHNGIVYKVYVIGDRVFIGKRPSLPNVDRPTPDSLREFAREMEGEYVTVSTPEMEGGACPGYVVFYSNLLTRRKGVVACQELLEHGGDAIDDCLDPAVVAVLRTAFASEWNIELFGFDLLIHKDTKQHFVVDCNVFPGYKGVDGFLNRMNELFSSHAGRRTAREDVAGLMSDTEGLKRYCAETFEDWASGGVSPSDVDVKLTVNPQTAKLSIPDAKYPRVSARRVVLTFSNPRKPSRLLHDEANFVGNAARQLSDLGLGPMIYKNITASYYGCERHLGRVEEWVSGYTLLKAMQSVDTDCEAMFSCVGRSLADLHAVMRNESFKKSLVDYHFGPAASSDLLLYTVLETWRRRAVIFTEKSGLSRSEQWSGFYKEFLQYIDIESVKKTVHAGLRSMQSTRLVYSHFDLNLSNAIVDNLANPTKVTLIDVEWSGPSLAVYDFAKLISSLELQISHGEVDFNMEQVDVFLRRVIAAYLETAGGLSEGIDETQREKEVSDLLCDCYTFVPIACMLNVYSNFVHASFDGQLSDTVSEWAELGKRGTNFNWIRHAFDHFECFKKYYSRLQSGSPANGANECSDERVR